MHGGSLSEAEWFSQLEPAAPHTYTVGRDDDPRLGDVVEIWDGKCSALNQGRAVIIGFPQDEGVRRNNGRVGAAEAPKRIRQWLYRLTPWDGAANLSLADHPPLDLGSIRVRGSLEETQACLGQVIAEVLKSRAVPVILGGGHETAYAHYLGYVGAELPVGIINVDAHLDVRPCIEGKGHSGSPFRQALEHPTRTLPGNRYACLGAQPYSVSLAHYTFIRERGGQVYWCDEIRNELAECLAERIQRFAAGGCRVYVSVDADVVAAAEVPGVSAPNSNGLSGTSVLSLARAAGSSPQVASFDLVEINPRVDRDDQSSRWAALAVWNFLIGMESRRHAAQAG